MSKMRYVNTDFWSDRWVVDSLNPLDRYLFVYLFTNSHTTIAGVYELSLRVMSFETGITANDLATMLKRLEPKVKYVDGWVVLRNGIKNQNYHSPKIKTGIDMALQKCPPELIELLKWPDDYETAKPEGSTQQQQLIIDDLEGLGVSKTVEKKATVDKNGVAFKATRSSVKYGMHELSHSNSNYKAVGNSKAPPASTRSASRSKVDQELAAKERAAMNRKPGPGYAKALSTAELIRKRRKT